MLYENVATYSYRKIDACVKEVNRFYTETQAITKRKDHFDLLEKLYKLYDFCFQNTDCILFDCKVKSMALTEYLTALNAGKSKKILDQKLHYVLVSDFKYEISEIKNMMLSGEVNAIY